MYVLIGVVFGGGITASANGPVPFVQSVYIGVLWPLHAGALIANVAKHITPDDSPQSPEE